MDYSSAPSCVCAGSCKAVECLFSGGRLSELKTDQGSIVGVDSGVIEASEGSVRLTGRGSVADARSAPFVVLCVGPKR